VRSRAKASSWTDRCLASGTFSYYDLVFACSAPGYTLRTETMASALSPFRVGSFLLVDFGIVDSPSSAWMKYPTKITVVLSKAPRA